MKQLELCTPEPTKIDLEKTEVNSYAQSVSTIVKSEQTVKERIQIETTSIVLRVVQREVRTKNFEGRFSAM